MRAAPGRFAKQKLIEVLPLSKPRPWRAWSTEMLSRACRLSSVFPLLPAVSPTPSFLPSRVMSHEGWQGSADAGKVDFYVDKKLSISFLLILFLLTFYFIKI
jgi:hypothetical protein